MRKAVTVADVLPQTQGCQQNCSRNLAKKKMVASTTAIDEWEETPIEDARSVWLLHNGYLNVFSGPGWRYSSPWGVTVWCLSVHLCLYIVLTRPPRLICHNCSSRLLSCFLVVFLVVWVFCCLFVFTGLSIYSVHLSAAWSLPPPPDSCAFCPPCTLP